MIGAIKAMKNVNNKNTMKSEATGEQWENVDKIPMGDTFMEALKGKQEIFGKEDIRVTAFATIISKFKLNILKFDANVFKFLQEKKLYIKLNFLRGTTPSARGLSHAPTRFTYKETTS